MLKDRKLIKFDVDGYCLCECHYFYLRDDFTVYCEYAEKDIIPEEGKSYKMICDKLKA